MQYRGKYRNNVGSTALPPAAFPPSAAPSPAEAPDTAGQETSVVFASEKRRHRQTPLRQQSRGRDISEAATLARQGMFLFDMLPGSDEARGRREAEAAAMYGRRSPDGRHSGRTRQAEQAGARKRRAGTQRRPGGQVQGCRTLPGTGDSALQTWKQGAENGSTAGKRSRTGLPSTPRENKTDDRRGNI